MDYITKRIEIILNQSLIKIVTYKTTRQTLWIIFPDLLEKFNKLYSLGTYLSGARCTFAYGPADGTATHFLYLRKSRLVLFVPF